MCGGGGRSHSDTRRSIPSYHFDTPVKLFMGAVREIGWVKSDFLAQGRGGGSCAREGREGGDSGLFRVLSLECFPAS